MGRCDQVNELYQILFHNFYKISDLSNYKIFITFQISYEWPNYATEHPKTLQNSLQFRQCVEYQYIRYIIISRKKPVCTDKTMQQY